jgi:hypothetical protein
MVWNYGRDLLFRIEESDGLLCRRACLEFLDRMFVSMFRSNTNTVVSELTEKSYHFFA